MTVRAIDGRYLGHPFFFSIEEELPWQRLSPASKFIQSSCQSFGIQKLEHEMVTGKQNCKLLIIPILIILIILIILVRTSRILRIEIILSILFKELE